MAAAYLYHIARAHAFQNGNKRTAYVAALTFLELNHFSVPRESAALEDATVAVAEGAKGKDDIAAIFRALSGCDD